MLTVNFEKSDVLYGNGMVADFADSNRKRSKGDV